MRAWKAVLVGLAALAAFWFAAVSFRGQRPPAHVAEATVPAAGLALTAELFALSHLTEWERHLVVSTPADGATLRVRMADVQSPAHRTSLYRVGGAEIAVLGPAGDDYFFAAGPLRRLGGPSRPSGEWTYLGAFDLRTDPEGSTAGGPAQVFAFIAAEAEEECIPTILQGAQSGPHRREHASRTCPRPDPTPAPEPEPLPPSDRPAPPA